MSELFKICIHHGELKQEDIYKKKRGNKIDLKCNICRKIQDRRGGKKRRETHPPIYKNVPVSERKLDVSKKCSKHGDLPLDRIYINARGNAVCKICKNESARRLMNIELSDDITHRICSKCKIQKPLNDFRKHDKSKRFPYCAICRTEANIKNYNTRRSYLKLKYGMTIQQYEKMYEEQKGLCAICSKPETAKVGGTSNLPARFLSVDHCHEADKNGIKKPRALLCGACNRSLGLIKENADTARSMANYIETICKKPA
jgi:hypothetical protein